jgi:hypothetical protein
MFLITEEDGNAIAVPFEIIPNVGTMLVFAPGKFIVDQPPELGFVVKDRDAGTEQNTFFVPALKFTAELLLLEEITVSLERSEPAEVNVPTPVSHSFADGFSIT